MQVLFEPAERDHGICWHYRRNGYCKRGKECPYKHILDDGLNLQDLSERIERLKRTHMEFLERGGLDQEFKASELIPSGAESIAMDHSVKSEKKILCYWISRAKELKFKASALRKTFEENGFTLVSSNVDEDKYHLAVFWGHTFPRYNIVKWNELPSYTLINNFPNSHELCTKVGLNYLLDDHVVEFNGTEFSKSYGLWCDI